MRTRMHRSRLKVNQTLIIALLAISACPALAVERIITIGDSWAYLVADYGSVQLMLNTFFPGQGYTVANESFGGGTAAQHAASLADITARINAHPTADVVWLSSGGNDMLLGQAGGGWYLGMPNEAGLFDTIGANVQTVVNHILSLRPDIQIVIIGYDYPNPWDFDLRNGGNAQVLRANYALGLGGTGWIGSVPTFEIAQQQAWNAAFRGMEQRKVALGANSRRVHHVNNYALVDYLYGYNGFFGTWPSGTAYNDLPVTKSKLGSSGTDPIHLNTDGYNAIALNAYNNFFNTAFQPAVLSLNTTTIAFGNVRIGTNASGSATAGNSGPNFTKVKNLTFPAASGEFGGGSQGFNPLFKDPSLGTDTATKAYSYAPINRGPDSQALIVTSDSGTPTLTLTGTGVGPAFQATPGSLSFGDVPAGEAPSLPLSVSNATPDPDLGNLTNLTLLSAQITGPDAALFSLQGFTAGTVLGKNAAVNLSVVFNASAPPGVKTATLTIQTDEGTAFGGSGQGFTIPLSGATLQTYQLTLTVINSLYGTVEVEPNLPAYAAGAQVTLTAIPNENRSLRQWEIYDPNYPGDANYAVIDANNPLVITMDRDMSVGAVFKCGSGMSPLPIGIVLLALGGFWLGRNR